MLSRRYTFLIIFILAKASIYLYLEYSYLIKKYEKQITIKSLYKSSGLIGEKNIIMDDLGDEYEIDDKFFTEKEKNKLWRELSQGNQINIEYHGKVLPFLNNHLKIINMS
tara:strand:+ start:976 stop:1305 length:330 start_codon:yes stop_codon:yes gene_type:complete